MWTESSSNTLADLFQKPRQLDSAEEPPAKRIELQVSVFNCCQRQVASHPSQSSQPPGFKSRTTRRRGAKSRKTPVDTAAVSRKQREITRSRVRPSNKSELNELEFHPRGSESVSKQSGLFPPFVTGFGLL